MAYNGWTNYFTWRLALGLGDGLDWYEEASEELAREMGDKSKVLYALSQRIKEGYEDVVGDMDCDWKQDFVQAGLGQVNWYELAEIYEQTIDECLEEDYDEEEDD